MRKSKIEKHDEINLSINGGSHYDKQFKCDAVYYYLDHKDLGAGMYIPSWYQPADTFQMEKS